MSVLPLRVILAALLLEDDDLFAAGLADDRGHDRSTLNGGAADLRLVAADHQHITERDLLVFADPAEHVTLDLQAIALGHSILLSTGLDDGVHNVLQQIGTAGFSTRDAFAST